MESAAWFDARHHSILRAILATEAVLARVRHAVRSAPRIESETDFTTCSWLVLEPHALLVVEMVALRMSVVATSHEHPTAAPVTWARGSWLMALQGRVLRPRARVRCAQPSAQCAMLLPCAVCCVRRAAGGSGAATAALSGRRIRCTQHTLRGRWSWCCDRCGCCCGSTRRPWSPPRCVRSRPRPGELRFQFSIFSETRPRATRPVPFLAASLPPRLTRRDGVRREVALWLSKQRRLVRSAQTACPKSTWRDAAKSRDMCALTVSLLLLL